MAKVFIGSDHGGFELKEGLRKYVAELGFEVVDVGCHSKEAADFPDYAMLVAGNVATAPDSDGWRFGIMIDTIGAASAIVANKVPGIRAAPCWTVFGAGSARSHNNANVLTLGGGVVGLALAKEIVKTFLTTEFAGGRHLRRFNKMLEVEKRFMVS